MLSLLRGADDDPDRFRNYESARDDGRRDDRCCRKASPATCSRRANCWPRGHRCGRRVLCRFPADELVNVLRGRCVGSPRPNRIALMTA